MTVQLFLMLNWPDRFFKSFLTDYPICQQTDFAEHGSELCMIWSYILQDSYASVIYVVMNVVIDMDTIFKWFTQKMFLEIT